VKLALAAALALAASGARAAELPTRLHDPKREPPKARTCEIDGERGVALPGGGCVKVGGYVSVGAAANLKH
jgi:hypothetical protein